MPLATILLQRRYLVACFPGGVRRWYRIQLEVIGKMTNVAEAFFQEATDKGIYRQMDAKLVSKVFLRMFAVAGFSDTTIMEADASPQQLQEMAEGLADIFLNGVLA
jgi:hypothetical protein